MIDPGTEIDARYRVIRLLGEGGMGAVYEVEHLGVGKRLAVKMLHAHYARQPEAVKRFAREARAAAAIGHPNIVEVIDTGMHLAEPYMVMELLRGETLAERLARAAVISTRETCVIIGSVLSALASAHSKGIVHRDLKPENVFLADHGGTTVKLLDFGVSKFRRDAGTLYETTQEGLPVGTPAYMAPEQWMGRRDIDHRADLFAVGVMLYEMLTGGFPYEGASQGELFLEIVRGSEAPPLPSSIAPGVPRAIDAVVLQALCRDRDERFQSAREFLEAIRDFGAQRIAVSDEPPVPQVMDALSTSPRRAFRRTMITSVEGRPRITGRQISVWAVLLSLVVLGLVVVAGARSTPPHGAVRRPVPSVMAPAPEPEPTVLPASPEVAPEVAPTEPVAVVPPPSAPAPSEELTVEPTRHRHRRHGSHHGRHAVHTERAPRTPHAAHAAPTARAPGGGRRGSGGGAGSLHISREW